MKYFLFLFFIFLLFSCGKISNKIGVDYHKVIGQWKNINGDENIRMKFSERGKVILEREFARGGSFYIDKFQYIGTSSSGLLPHSFIIKSKKYKRFGYGDALHLFSNSVSNFDTISITGFWLIENSTYQYNNVLFVRE